MSPPAEPHTTEALISIDDHIIESPDLFDGHLPAGYRDVAPCIARREDGAEVWRFEKLTSEEVRARWRKTGASAAGTGADKIEA